jgi:hypothetical protein
MLKTAAFISAVADVARTTIVAAEGQEATSVPG